MSSVYRTYSSPNLRAAADYYNQDENQVFFIVGDRVYLDGYRAASVAYFGEVEFSSGDWVGLVLDFPTGNHDGRVHGRRYFQCEPLHGIFARPSRVTRMSDMNVSTPQPSSSWLDKTDLLYQESRSSDIPDRSSRSSSGLGASYIYDDDYRSSPSVNTLEQKLKLFDRASSLPRHSGGILKRPSSSSRPTSRADEILERLEKATTPTMERNRSPSVFEFRPKRTQLEEYENYKDRVSFNKLSNDLSSKPLRLHDRVTIRTERGEEGGILRYIGETKFATGEWAGVELDSPNGRNDGSVLGHRYFYCPQGYGLFVPLVRVKRNFSNIRNTIKSPPYANISNEESRFIDSFYHTNKDRPYSAGSSSTYSEFSGRNTHDNYTPRSWLTGTPQPKGYLTTTRPNTHSIKTSTTKPNTAKSVIYTFTSSKYDGNPVAHRTLSYE